MSYNGEDWGGTYRFETAGGSSEAVLVPWVGYWINLVARDVNYSLVITRPQRENAE